MLTLSPKLVGGYKAVDELLAVATGIPRHYVVIPRAGDDVVVWGTFNTADTRHEVTTALFTGPHSVEVREKIEVSALAMCW